MKAAAPLLLSVNGGYVDAVGFLALQGHFTSHVTGNFVTAGAALVFGTTGVAAKLLALPVFAVVVALARILGKAMAGHPARRWAVLLTLQLVLLLTGGILAIRVGPFANGDAAAAMLMGMVLVSGMAIQNALHRVHLAAFPPATIMTGNTTQLVLDAVDVGLIRTGDDLAVLRGRLARTAAVVGCFAGGCVAAAVAFWLVGMWCFVVPPIRVLGALLLG
jgi:uncharacterized membrane protein YoaK (UPF0700 family)